MADDRAQRSKDQGFLKTFFANQQKSSGAPAGKMKVEEHLSVSSEGITVREQRGLDLLKGMLEVYFSIIRRKVCDQVPKAVMAMLVNRLKDQLYGVLVAKLYSSERIEHLLKETDEVVNQRRHMREVHSMLSKAMEALDEVQGIGTKVVM